MTMPNPVAEVVSRLREAADNIERARMSGIVENLAGWEQRHARDAADLLERLSRERDTGVPTAAANPDACAAAPAVPSYVIVDTPKSEPNLTPSNVFPAEPASRLSAAPQPPTVSPDIVALTRERDQAREALARTERNRDMWKDQCARQADLLSAINELPQECVNSLTHQRQIDMDGCEVGVSRQAVDEIHAALMRARSVLDPEKEDHS